jgi:GrpB-like predicted nucleotidyltransferase (UPF0157 family)
MGAGDDRPPSRRRYLEAKRELAARDWEFVQQYADAKSRVVEAIIARALADPDGATETR